MASEKQSVCPHCKEVVNPKATRCPHCHGKINRGIGAGGVVLILIILGTFGSIAASLSPSSSNVSSQTSTPFSVVARTHFNSILEVSPELQAINCEGGDCTSVIYFDYKTVPEDVETVIRGNAATFSKLKLTNTGVSHVTVAGRYNNAAFFACNAASGVVQDCDHYAR